MPGSIFRFQTGLRDDDFPDEREVEALFETAVEVVRG